MSILIEQSQHKITLDLPRISDDPGEIKARFASIPATLETDEQLSAANLLLQDAARAKKDLENAFDEPTKAANEAHKFLTSQRGRLCAPYADMDKALRVRICTYLDEKKRKADEERKRLEAIERQRLEEEALALAAALEADGKTGEAREVIEQAEIAPVAVSAPIAAPPKEAMVGNNTRSAWAIERIDLLALVQAAAKNPDRYLKYLVANESLINSEVRTLKAACNIPGVHTCEKTVMALGRI